MKVHNAIILLIILSNVYLSCMKNNFKYNENEKEKFIEKLLHLPNYGDRYDLNSVKIVQRNIHILLSITDNDFKLYLKKRNLEEKDHDIFPLLIVSQQLCIDEKGNCNMKNIELFINKFKEIPDSKIKKFWTATVIYCGFKNKTLIDYFKKEIMNNISDLQEIKSYFGEKEWRKIENFVFEFK